MIRVGLSLEPIGADFVHAPGSAKRAWASRDGVLLRVRHEGLTGIGEASPLEGVSVETSVDVHDALSALGDSLEVELGEPGTVPTTPRALPPAARFGLETALLDLASRRAGMSLAAWLAAPGTPASSVTTQMLLDRLDGIGALECAFEVGARAVKVKIGRKQHLREEIELLKEIRKLSPDAVIRADANGVGVSSDLLQALVDVGCALLEDPCPLEELDHQRWPLPIALDEPLYSDPEAAFEAVEGELASSIVLKPALVGGLGVCLRHARRAQALGASVILSHSLESPIGLAASAHLALAVGGGQIHGLGRWEGLERFEANGIAIPVPRWIGAAKITLPELMGLGLSV